MKTCELCSEDVEKGFMFLCGMPHQWLLCNDCFQSTRDAKVQWIEEPPAQFAASNVIQPKE